MGNFFFCFKITTFSHFSILWTVFKSHSDYLKLSQIIWQYSTVALESHYNFLFKISHFVRLIFIVQYARLLFRKREKKADVCYHLYISMVMPWDWMEVRLMIEVDLIIIIYLLFYGMIASTIINVALIIATAILLIKQQ